MNTQLINYSGRNDDNFSVSETNKLSDIKTFDSFDVNIIDLTSTYIWRYQGDSISNFDSKVDFRTISAMVRDSVNPNSAIVFLLPQNIDFIYRLSLGKEYYKYIPLKNMMSQLEEHLNVVLPEFSGKLTYGKNETLIGDISFNSDFYFSIQNDYKQKESTTNHIYSYTSKKLVSLTVKNKFYITTLSLDSQEQLNICLEKVGLVKPVKEDVPDWIYEVVMFDDEKQKENIISAEQVISSQNEIIRDAKERLEINNRYKSILYTQGDELASVVTDILEQMLDIDLKEFEDILDADLEFKIGDIPFVVEIKGINTNVKNSNLTQLMNHAATYGEKNKVELDDIKRLLIVNHQRSKPLEDREPVHEKQITYAKNRFDILIIETTELLKMFEEFKTENFSVEECRAKIMGNGILSV